MEEEEDEKDPRLYWLDVVDICCILDGFMDWIWEMKI